MPCNRICKTSCPTCSSGYDNDFEEMRKNWEEWDLRIQLLFILFTQLYLHFFGRRRRKSMARLLMNVNVWLLYLFSDLLATIALGKLSKVILFFLGGPDTMTILRLEENHLWVRHLIGLFTQGVRTLYVLIVTWTPGGLSILALMLLIPGIIKYGERVWVIRSRSEEQYQGFIQFDASRIDEISNSASQPNARLVLEAYSWFQTLKPHIADYECNRTRLKILVTRFSESVRTGAENLATWGTVIENSFKLIEIELGLIYDIVFSKMPPGHLEGDFHITIILLLVGAIFLEIAGILVQLVSDWLFEKSQKGSDALQTSAMKRGEWSTEKYNFQQFKWSVELEFDRSLVIWHLATYDYDEVKELVGGGSRWSDAKACKNLLEKKIDSSSTTVAKQVQKLGKGLREEDTVAKQVQMLAKGLREKEDRWEIMSNVWVEMLCYASSQCPLKHHVQELRHGGDFLTHVWLLLMHFGVGEKGGREIPLKSQRTSTIPWQKLLAIAVQTL
ncbi:hypothetical protein Acr_08g0004960 [Actinidia rufa]|uniref:DUF4220 domain-containing protein n=1 Tax=Actinidia rufa TaxID=165716 RepID=A0A7J0F096_9ERIC|nr:hypothetical protein Acr_08g0004960 [Actinidia rufa]